MVGRLADTELPGRQRQGETNPDRNPDPIQCGRVIWIMLKCFRNLSAVCLGKAVIELCLEAVLEVVKPLVRCYFLHSF